MPTNHKNLTGADLHEPKGVENATLGQVYVADGAGSGSWQSAVDLLTAASWRTGCVRLEWNLTAETGWIVANDGTIGDASSGGTTRANSDTEDLFTLIWNTVSNTYCPIYTSAGSVSTRGASAAADFAAHKRLALPRMLGRVIGISSSTLTGSGLTRWDIGQYTGVENVTLDVSQIPSHTHSVSDPGHMHNHNGTFVVGTSVINNVSGGGASTLPLGATNPIIATAVTGISIVAAGGGGSHTNMQPSVYLVAHVKL